VWSLPKLELIMIDSVDIEQVFDLKSLTANIYI
jgi:hypothetical protein